MRLATELAAAVRGGDSIFLRGDLGIGKTALAGAMLRALGYQGLVKSPTYTIIEEYSLPELRVIHADLYRLDGQEDLESLGWRDYLDSETLIIIEWPERAFNFVHGDVDVWLTLTDDARRAQLRPLSPRGEDILENVET